MKRVLIKALLIMLFFEIWTFGNDALYWYMIAYGNQPRFKVEASRFKAAKMYAKMITEIEAARRRFQNEF